MLLNALRDSKELRATVEFRIERPPRDSAQLHVERQGAGLESEFKSKINFFENQSNFIDVKKRQATNGRVSGCVRRTSCYEVLREGKFVVHWILCGNR